MSEFCISQDAEITTNPDPNREHVAWVVRMTTAVDSSFKSKSDSNSLDINPNFFERFHMVTQPKTPYFNHRERVRLAQM